MKVIIRCVAVYLSKLSDDEFVQMNGGVGDPDLRQMLLSEERRRSMEHTTRVNNIAVGVLLDA